MNPERCDERAHALLEKKCRIMDYLPAQLPPGSRGRYFDVECCLLNHYDRFGLCERITAALLKLLCYRHAAVLWGGWYEDPAPALVAEAVREIMENHSGSLNILLPEDNALVVFSWDCLFISVYNAKGRLRRLLKKIARSEGLAWRKADR